MTQWSAPARRTRRAGLVGLAVTTLILTAAAVPAALPSADAATTAPYCGPRINKSLFVAWRCTFADEFSGTALDSTKWSPLLTSGSGVVTPECRIASDNNIRVANGSLELTVRREPAPFTCVTRTGSYSTEYTGGAVTTYNKFAQAYGRYEIRAAFPDAKVKGLHSALWMWPQTMKYGDASGEIDIAEFKTGLPDRVIPYVHYKMSYDDDSVTNNYCMVDRPEDFHTYLLEWTTTTIKVSYDGKVCIAHRWHPAAPLSRPAPFNQPFAMILNQGMGTQWNVVDSETAPVPATMYVDYVRVWS